MGNRKERIDTFVVRSIQKSSRKFGQLYPILVDFHDEIIDGEHRRIALENPKTFKVTEIKTKKDRLEARLVANHARKGQHKSTWIPTLTELAKLLEKEGIQKIGLKIAEETGLPYRTLMRYLPQEFKDSAQSERASHPRMPNDNQEILEKGEKEEEELPPQLLKESSSSFEGVLYQPIKEVIEEYNYSEDEPRPKIKIQKFSNQSWKAILVPKDFMDKLEKASKKRNIGIEEAVTLALMKLLHDLRKKKSCLQEKR